MPRLPRLLLLGALLPALSASAQVSGAALRVQWKTLYDSAQLYLDRGDYRQAGRKADSALKLARRILPPHDSDFRKSIYLSGECLRKQARFAPAQKLFEYELALTSARKDSFYANSLEHMGNLAYSRSAYVTAARWFDRAIRLRLSLGRDAAYAGLLNDRALVYAAQGRYSEGIALLHQTVRIKDSLGLTATAPFATNLSNLGYLHNGAGRYDSARWYRGQALALRRRLLPGGLRAYINEASELADLFDQRGDRDSACRLYRELLEQVPADHDQYPLLLVNLALYFEENGNADSTDHYFRQALEVQARRGQSGSIYTSVMSAVGEWMQKQGKADSAEACYRHALRSEERRSGRGVDYAVQLVLLSNFYATAGQPARAEQLKLRALQLCGQVSGKESEDALLVLRNLAAFYYSTERYGQAERTLLRCLALAKRVYGKDHPTCAQILNNLAAVYAKNPAKGPQAINSLSEISRIYAAAYGKQSNDYLIARMNVAYVYLNSGQFALALPPATEVEKGWRALYGTGNSYYWSAVALLGQVYQGLGEKGKATTYLEQALALRQAAGDTASEDFQSALADLALVYTDSGKYAAALPLRLRALELRKKLDPATPAKWVDDLSALAGCYWGLDSLEQAHSAYREAVRIMKTDPQADRGFYETCLRNVVDLCEARCRPVEALEPLRDLCAVSALDSGRYSHHYIASLMKLVWQGIETGNYRLAQDSVSVAYTLEQKVRIPVDLHLSVAEARAQGYVIRGDLGRAVSLLTKTLAEAVAWERNHPPKDHSITLLSDLGQAYHFSGDLKRAEQCLRKALAEAEIRHANDPDALASYRSRLAELLEDKGNPDAALPLREAALKSFSGKKPSVMYAMVQEALASVLTNRKQFGRADSLFRSARAQLANLVDSSSDVIAAWYGSRGYYWFDVQQFDSALQCAQRQLAIYARAGEGRKEYYIHTLNKLGRYYLTNNRLKEARHYLGEGLSQWYRYMRRQLGALSSAEQEKMIQRFNGPQDAALSALSQYYLSDEPFRRQLFETIAGYNGLVLQGQSLLGGWVRRQKDSAVLRRYQEWRSRNEQLTAALQRGDEASLTDSLEQEADNAQKELLAAAPSFARVFQKDTISTARVARSLQRGEVLVNWVPYRWYRPGHGYTDSIFYGAFILRPGSSVPQFLNVFEQAPLQQALRFYYNKGDRGIGLRQKADSLSMDSLQKRLYQLVWQPLEPYLQGAKRVFLLPGGLLNKLSFNALIDPRDSFLIDRYELHTILNIRDLEARSATARPLHRISLFGGALYDSAATVSTALAPDSSAAEVLYLPGKGSRAAGAGFGYLEGTRLEVERIGALPGLRSTLYKGRAASEGNFKRQSGDAAPEVLHIATHGFYFPPQKAGTDPSEESGERFRQSDQPLLRSGLVLSGVNRYWNRRPPPGTEDGILTAQEIAGLDFADLQLVVLSACQTALGDINNSQGVYGLQRAFRMAGVQDMIISLWEVPDAETAELMTLFYNGLEKGLRPYDAFRAAQQQLKSKYHDPHKWAAFILLGE